MSNTIVTRDASWENVFESIEKDFIHLISHMSPTLKLKELDQTDKKIKEQLEQLNLFNEKIDKEIKKIKNRCWCLCHKPIVVLLIISIFQIFIVSGLQSTGTYASDPIAKGTTLGANIALTVFTAGITVYTFIYSELKDRRDGVSTLIKEAITQTKKFKKIVKNLKEIKNQGEKNMQIDDKISNLVTIYKTLPSIYKKNDGTTLSELVSYGISNLPPDDPILKDIQLVSSPTELKKVYLPTEKSTNWNGEKGLDESPENPDSIIEAIFKKISERFKVNIDYINTNNGKVLKKEFFLQSNDVVNPNKIVELVIEN